MNAGAPDPKEDPKKTPSKAPSASQAEWERKQAPVPAEQGGNPADQKAARPRKKTK
jgi:hypothetical protein